MELHKHVDRTFWFEVAKRSPEATFFHTPYWQDLALGAHSHYRDATIGATLPDGTRAVLPLLEVRRRGPLRELWSSHELYYGGVVADQALSAASVRRLYRAACGPQTLRLRLTGNPLMPTTIPSDFRTEQDFTHLVWLEDGFDAVFARFSAERRTGYRSGIRKGVQVRQANTIEDYQHYFALYQNTMARWAQQGIAVLGSPYQWEQFVACHQLATLHPDVARLWLAEQGGQVIGGCIVFYWNRHAIYWHGAIHSDFLQYRPSNVLHTEIIRDAIGRNIACYDLGPSGGVSGVIAHKDGYATRTPFARVTHTPAPLALAQQLMTRTRIVR